MTNTQLTQPTSARWEDEAAIRALTDRFADAANRRDARDFSACWDETGTWDIGAPMNVQVAGRAALEETFARLMGHWEFFVQMPNAGVITLQGDLATARWTMNEIGIPKNEAGEAPKGHFNLSTYTDELVKRDGHWLFARRTYRFLYLDETALAGQIMTAT